MKKYTCIIADDEALARELLASHLSKIPNFEIIANCGSAVEARFALQKHQPDLLFLDIQMPDLTGIELLRMLPKRPATILTTAFSEHALEGYELDVLDYLLKPIEFERFFKAVSKATDWLERGQVNENQTIAATPLPTRDPYFFVKSDSKILKVMFEDILFVEALQKYVRIHTTSERIVSLMGMGQLEAALPTEQFFRCHRSFILNLEKIERIEGHEALVGKHRLPVSKGQWDSFLAKIKEKSLKSF